MASQDDDPDREIPAILLQHMRRDTLRAVLADPNAIRKSLPASLQQCAEECGDVEQSASLVFGALQNQRREHQKALQKDCLLAWIDKGDTDIVGECFRAFRRNMREEIMARAMRAASASARIRKIKKQEKKAQAKQQLGRLSSKERSLTDEEAAQLGRYIKYLSDDLSHNTDLYVVGVSTAGKAWELNDGSFVQKDLENQLWSWDDARDRAQVEAPKGSRRPRSARRQAIALPVSAPELTQRQIGLMEAQKAKQGILFEFKLANSSMIYAARPQSARTSSLRRYITADVSIGYPAGSPVQARRHDQV